MGRRKRETDLVRYSFKGPGHGRKSFTVYRDVKGPDGKRSYETIEDDRLMSINMAFQSATSTLEQCTAQVKEIIQDLYKQDPRCRKKRVIHNNENWSVFDKFWDEIYAHRPLISEYSAKIEFRNAIDVLGPLSIYSASRDEIQKCIDQRYEGDAQRRVVTRMHQLLKYIGREKIKLRKVPRAYFKVTYLTEEEFRKVLTFVDSEIEAALLKLCFYAGLRIGEAYGVELRSLLPNNTIRVSGQVDRNGVFRHTKTKRPRLAYIFPEGIQAFHRWVSATPEERATIDRNDASRDLMKKYCMKAFPNDPSKHLTFHALRHCYAINLLSKGVSMSLVAQSLGNTLSVCQQHYVGFELSSESIEAINAIVGRK